MIGQNIVVTCEGGWKYTGKLLDMDATVFTRPKWLKMQTKKKVVYINIDRVITIIVHADTDTNRE